MPGSRLKDVLDDKPLDKSKWDIIFGKLKKLGTAIEMYYGPSMDIDDVEYRWVNDRIEYYEKKGRLLNKQEMKIANDMWNRYHPKKQVKEILNDN
tara:strand:- start:190 stop:474 length:285 start_codon:yes stop_codon:yes gene_type:complete